VSGLAVYGLQHHFIYKPKKKRREVTPDDKMFAVITDTGKKHRDGNPALSSIFDGYSYSGACIVDYLSEKIKQGGALMELQEFLGSIQDLERRGAIENALAAALSCIQHHRSVFGIQEEMPWLQVYEEDTVQAVASEGMNCIRFSTGLIDHYMAAKYPDISKVLPGAPNIFGLNLVLDLGLAWALSHEYVHLYRKHDSVCASVLSAALIDHSLTPQRKRSALSLSKEDIDKATEFDADLCAVAGIYRYMQKIFAGLVDDMLIRKMVIFYVYWGVRGFPDIQHSGTHPEISDRLYDICSKVGGLSAELSVSKYAVPEGYKSKVERVVILTSFVMEMEKIYIGSSGVKEVDAIWHKWLERIRTNAHTRSAANWSKLSPWVGEISGTLADNRKDEFYFARQKQKKDAKFSKEKKKSQRKARRGSRVK